METSQALWPDTGDVQNYHCWNCGKLAKLASGGSTRMYCADCDVAWSVRFGHSDQTERGFKTLRDKALSTAQSVPLVDFTSEDAPSAPA